MESEIKEGIHASLRVAAQLIDKSVDQLNHSGLNEIEIHRHGLAKALFEILQVVDVLCGSTSGLRKKQAEATRLEDAYNEIYKEAAFDAQILECRCGPLAAVDRYINFLTICGSHRHRALARADIERLKILAALIDKNPIEKNKRDLHSLRHKTPMSIEKAYEIAEIEQQYKIKSRST